MTDKCNSCGRLKIKLPICPECENQITQQNEHPIHTTLRFFGLLGVAAFTMKTQATSFDHTELAAIAIIGGLVAPVMFKSKIVKAIKKLAS